MKSFPKAKTLDRTIDSWLRQWQIMIGNQFDQEGDQVRGKKWLSDLALKFENAWPFLAQKVLDISGKVVPRSPRSVVLVDSVLQKVRDAQQFEPEKQQQEGDRKRTRGEAFANFDVTGGPADEHHRNARITLVPRNSASPGDAKPASYRGTSLKIAGTFLGKSWQRSRHGSAFCHLLAAVFLTRTVGHP